MVQLIITLIAIALTVLLAVASINYLPWWHKTAADTEETVRTSMKLLEQTFDVVVRASNGVVPVQTGEADGGLMTHFGAHLVFAPAAPAGYQWTYGRHGVDGSRYSGLGYFCLVPTNSNGADQGVYRGIERARSVFSRDQVIVANQCAANESAPTPTQFPAPVAVTMYVVFTPGVNR